MTLLIIIIGALVLLAGIIILVSPEIIFDYLRKESDKLTIQVLAVVVRLVIGALLISQSDVSRYPLVITVLGWLAIIAAISLAVIGRSNFKRLMTWALTIMKPYSRIGGIFAMAFGGFLIYAFV